MTIKRDFELRKIVAFLIDKDYFDEITDAYYECQIFDKTKNQNIVTWDLDNNPSWEVDEVDKSDPEIQKLMGEGNVWLKEEEKKDIIQYNAAKEIEDVDSQMCSEATHILKRVYVPSTWVDDQGEVKEKLYNKEDFINEGSPKISDLMKCIND